MTEKIRDVVDHYTPIKKEDSGTHLKVTKKEGELQKRIKKLLGDSSIEFMVHATILEMKKEAPKWRDEMSDSDKHLWIHKTLMWFKKWLGDEQP